jgi:hypothetical protein
MVVAVTMTTAPLLVEVNVCVTNLEERDVGVLLSDVAVTKVVPEEVFGVLDVEGVADDGVVWGFAVVDAAEVGELVVGALGVVGEFEEVGVFGLVVGAALVVEFPSWRLAKRASEVARGGLSRWTASRAWCSEDHTPCWNRSGKYLCSSS